MKSPRSKKESHVGIPLNHLYSLLLYSARYALERHSYAVDEVAEMIKAYGRHLSKDQLEIILKDVNNIIEQRNKSQVNFECDIKTLKDLQEYLKTMMR